MPLCSIFLDKPDGTYYPGDTVTGTVSVNNDKSMKARSVTISWSGISTISKGIGKPTFKKDWLSGSELMWVAKDEKSELSAGVHEFPFSINLPADCPPTHKMRHTENAYKLEVVIDRPWRFNTTVEKKIVVTKKLDTPKQMIIHSQTFRKSGWIFNSGPVTIKLSCPITAQPGETINLEVKVTNNSSATVDRLYVFFRKQVHYHSRCQHTPCKSFYSDNGCPSARDHRGYSVSIVKHSKFAVVNVPPYSDDDYTMEFEIPKNATTPNFANGLMNFGYFMGVGFMVSGSMFYDHFIVTMNVGEVKKKRKKTKKQEALTTAPPPYSD